MAKTEVILTQHIVGLGGESDQVKVASGYARNYLYPQGFAIPVSDGNKRRLEALRQRRAEREAHEFNTMSELSKSITKMTCVIKVKTGDDGKMFGSITNGAIADELKHQFDITLEKRKIHLENPIKALGEFEIELRLHPEVKATLKIKVESANPLPVLAAEPEDKAGDRPDGQFREKRSVRHGAQARTDAAPTESARAARPAAKSDKPAARTEKPGGKSGKSDKHS